MVAPSALPGISPTGGEIGWARGPPETTGVAAGRNGREAGRFGHLPISPPVGEMPGRAEGGLHGTTAKTVP
ncbi:diaminohydroxyphosphoribosylaminopyrimidine deaminase [Rhizobium phaseoli]|nr:diaminohydroxyphosphoribosylaminopyrimidine deaminase [Rhizobium phaseoli]